MSSRGSLSVARRYANAFLSVALDKQADPVHLDGELKEVAALMAREPRLALVLSSPTIPVAKRVGVLDAVVADQGLSPYTGNLLRLLTTKERMPLLPQVAEQFSQRVLEHRQVQSGEVVSAHALTNEQQATLAESLGKALAKTMELSYTTDPDLVGGLVVRIGNRVYDASVTTQLRNFKERALSSL